MAHLDSQEIPISEPAPAQEIPRERAFFWQQSLFGKISTAFLASLAIAIALDLLVWIILWRQYTDYTEQILSWGLAAQVRDQLNPLLEPPLNTQLLSEKIHQLELLNPHVDIYLVNSAGKILVSVGRVVRDTVDTAALERFLQVTSAPGSPLYAQDPRNEHLKSAAVIFSVARATIGGLPGYVYISLTGQSYNQIHSVLGEQDLQRAAIVYVGVTSIIVAVLGLISFKLITRRFTQMTVTVEKFSHGDYEQRLEISTNDEIGRLANTFNDMAQTIENNIRAMEDNDLLRRNLVANVSHDLRGPLTCVQGFLQMLDIEYSAQFEAKAVHYLDVIEKNIGHLRKLADGLFELSKLEARGDEPQLERFALEELCGDIVLRFSPQAIALGINLEAIAPENLPQVRADIVLIERVLSNLVDNALRYTPSGGTVRIALQQIGERIQILVEDTGKGIPQDDLQYLFERFYRVEKHRSKKEGGSGLGLAIVRRILEAHGETITVQSALGKGTVFEFHLPAWTPLE